MPSDVTAAVEQDQIAESLMSAPVVEAEPAEETEAEGAEQTMESETQTETAPETEETADYQLPTEQQKVYSQEALLEYAQQRWPKIHAMLEKDPTNEALIGILNGKLNADVLIQSLQEQPEAEEEQEETPEIRQEPTPTQLSAQEWAKQVDEVTKQYVNPEMAMHFAKGFMNDVFQVKEAPTPEMANKLAHVFTAGVINVVNSILPNMLNTPLAEGRTFFQDLMGKNYEGFDDTYESGMYDRAWSSVTRSNPAYAKLPSLNDEGGIAARQEAAAKIAGSVEDFDAMQFRGADGKPLSAYQTAAKKYSMLARVMAGDPLTPQQSKVVFEAGKKAARKAEVNRQAGNLGSGKSAGQIAQQPHGNDDIFGEGMEIYNREHGRL